MYEGVILHTLTHACIADINYSLSRELDQAQILRLADCTYIEKKHNIIIMGAAGSGKSYMACAFGIAACQNSILPETRAATKS